MSATGWSVTYDDRATSAPWTASHLGDSITVFGRDVADLGAEIRFEQRRRCFDARRNANGSR